MRFRFAALLLAPLALPIAVAPAADLGSVRLMGQAYQGAVDSYVVTVTANGQFFPRFPGSDKLGGFIYPSLNIRRADEPPRFAAPDDGISISFIDDDPAFRIGAVARVQAGRYLSDDRRLFRLRKIGFDIEPGLFVEYFPVSFIRTRLELRHGVLEGGFTGNAGIDFIAPVDRFTFSLGPRIGFADEGHVRRYFGVTPLEATRAPFFPRAYRPGGGFTSVGGLGAVTYRWSEQVATTGYFGYNRLIGDAGRRSPITRIGSADQLTFGASISYSFNFTPGVGITTR